MNISDRDSIKKEQLEADLSVSENNQIEVRGILNFETVPVLMKELESLLQTFDDAKVSFKGVTDSNSAGLALLLEMKRYMQTKNKNIAFADLPEQVRTIAHAYGIDAELGSFLDLQDFASV